MCMTFCVHETALTVQHHRKFLILHSHCSAQRDALKDGYYGLTIVLFLFLFLKDWKFSICQLWNIFNASTLENFQFISLELCTKDFKSTKNTSKYPLTGYRPLSRASIGFIIIFSFFLFSLLFILPQPMKGVIPKK